VGTACYTMDIMRSKKTVVLLAFLTLFLSGMLVVAFFSAKTHDTLQYGANPTLSSQITKYMEAQVGPRTYGHENYHCANKLIAYDEIHAYAWLFCQGYTNYSLGVNGTGEGFSVPFRFTYRQPGYSITAHDEPGDGSRYTSDLKRLFPRELQDEVSLSENYAKDLRGTVDAAARKQAGL
jgi:uncharacterized protein YneF (UPF0154 family)